MPIRPATLQHIAAAVLLVALPAAAGAGGEVIVIEGQRPIPHVRPHVTNHDPVPAPPYSDEAIEQDAWTRAWMLLDVDESGRVSRLKFIKRPGFKLEAIAMHQAFRLRFTPARDGQGRAIKSWVIWGIEWPSHGWLVTMVGTSTRMPPVRETPWGPLRLDANVPCRGSGPLHLDSIYPVYRDCSMPDLSQPFDAEPWFVPARARRKVTGGGAARARP